MKLKDSELKNILAEVETEIASLLKSEGDALKKATDSDGDHDGDEASASSAPAETSAPAEASSPAPEASAPPAAEASSPAPEASAPEASASPEMSAGAPAGDPAVDPVMDPAALQAEYSKLDPEALKAHYMAAKAALFAVMGAAAGAGPEASASMAPPSPAPAAPEASSTEVPPPALKAEVPATMKKNPANGALKEQAPAVPDAIKKSDDAAKVQDLEKQVEMLAKAVELAMGSPVRKAVTSLTGIETATPAKEPSKSEIKEKIRSALAGGKLTKSQREQLFSFTLGNTEFDQIKGLLP